MPLLIISVLFGLSLLAAWVLFAKLKGTAVVTNPKYQLGGAAAGFVVVMSLLSGTYIKVDDKNKQDQIKELSTKLKEADAKATAGERCVAEQSKEITYSGTVQPAMDDAYVVLSVSEGIVHPDGKFALKAPHIKPSDQPALYVIGANSRAPYKQLLAADDPPTNLTIPR
jgi:hypothetical protein